MKTSQEVMMIPHKTSNSLIIDIVSLVFLVGGLVLANLYSFLLFHTLVELFSIIISFTIYVVYWNTRRFLKNEYFLFLALSYFGTDQSQVQRYLGGKSIRESRLGLIFNGLLKIPMQFFNNWGD